MTVEDVARAAAQKRYPTLTPHPAEQAYPKSALRHYMQGAYIAGYKAGAQRPTGETHDEGTLQRVHDALWADAGLSPDQTAHAIHAMQNVGILFRERTPEAEFDRTAEHSRAEESAPAGERECPNCSVKPARCCPIHGLHSMPHRGCILR